MDIDQPDLNKKQDIKKIPPEVLEVLQKSNIGYLSVASPKGALYSYPVAFHFSGENVYFATPTGSAKFRFIKSNPKVSFVVDNRKLTEGACGAIIQGKATVYSIKKMFTSMISSISTTIHLSKKYPGLFSFYAKGKELPDERKFHKYRFIKITPVKIIYWVGYEFGRYFPRKAPGQLKRLFSDLMPNQKKTESTLEVMAEMLESGEEDLSQEELFSLNEPWVERLSQSTLKGEVSKEEKKLIELFTKSSSYPSITPQVSEEEKSILEKWRMQNRKLNPETKKDAEVDS